MTVVILHHPHTSAGPDHTEDGTDEKDGVRLCRATAADFGAYYQLWATKSATGTKAYNPTQSDIDGWKTSDPKAHKAYSSNAMSTATRAYIMNSPTVNISDPTKAASLILGSALTEFSECVIGVRSSHSEGLLKAVGGYSYVWNSKAYSPGLLQITGGHTKVIGAANTGRLEVSTTGTVKVADTTNSGSVKVTVSNDVFLSGITNKAGGTVSVTNVNASLYNIENAGDVTMSGGTGYAYGIKNSGKITVKTGSTLTLELVGAQCGTVTFEAGSKGTVTAPTGHSDSCPSS